MRALRLLLAAPAECSAASTSGRRAGGGAAARAARAATSAADALADAEGGALREMVSVLALRHRRQHGAAGSAGAGGPGGSSANGALPAHLERFVAEEMLRGAKGRRVRGAVSAMRSRVSKPAGRAPPPRAPRGQLEADAYVAGSLAGHHAILSRIASEVRARFPDFRPSRVLELCHGSAAVGSLACVPVLCGAAGRADITAVCESGAMRSAAAGLLRAARVAADGADPGAPRDNLTWHRRLPPAAGRADRFDLVVSAFSLSSLGDGGARREHLLGLWEHVGDGGMLILAENGNAEGCALVHEARRLLLERARSAPAAGGGGGRPAHIVGPCPHEAACPMGSRGRARCFFR